MMVKIRKGSYYRFNNIRKYKDYPSKNYTQIFIADISELPKIGSKQYACS